MMGRSPCCDESGLKKGPWTPEEDKKLVDYIERHGHGSWRALPKLAGLNRCGKSCRLRWTNYLRPDIKRGKFTDEEEQTIINLHSVLGNKWSAIAGHLPGRTDNEIKNFWNTHLRKKLLQMGIDPVTHRPRTDLNLLANLPQLLAAANLSNSLMLNSASTNNNGIPTMEDTLRLLESDATQLAKFHILQNMLQVLSPSSSTSPAAQITSLLNNPSMPFQNQLNDNLTRMAGSQVESGLTGEISQFPVLNPFVSSSFQTPASTHQNTSSSCHDHHFQPDFKHGCLRSSNTSNDHRNDDKQPGGEILNPDSIMPALVPGSPDHCSAHQIQLMSHSSELLNQKVDALMSSNPSSSTTTATPFDTAAANWTNDLIDDAAHSYWRDIIDQASSPSWPISS